MKENGWLKLLCSVVLVLVLFVITLPVMGVADFEFSGLELVTFKEIYEPTETIIIDTNPKLLSDDLRELVTLTIISSSRTFNYIGVPEFPVKFNFPEPGEYVIQLINKKTGEVISEQVINTVALQEGLEEVIEKDKEPSHSLVVEESQERSALPVLINNPGGLIVENHQSIKRPVAINQVSTHRGPGLLLNRPISSVESILFRGLRDQTPPRLGIEEITEPITLHGRTSVRSYAIDPTTVDFDEATVSVVAEGTTLYICKEYDFEAQHCYGDLQKMRGITPGEIYTFTLTPEDPLLVETNDTIECGFTIEETGTGGTISDSVTCEYTLQVPSGATSFFVEEVYYNVTVSFIHGNQVNIVSSTQSGYFDNDDALGNDNEILVGSSSFTTTTSTTWTNDDIDQTGDMSFNQDNCDNWPDYCTYYIHLTGSTTYTRQGQPARDLTFSVDLDGIGVAINYTEAGDFDVVLENPPNNFYSRAMPNQEFEYIPTSSNTVIENCSLYTSEGGWSAKNISTNIVNGTSNFLSATFDSEGSYSWNVICIDDDLEEARSITNRTIIIDRTPPVVNLVSPADEATITEESVVPFVFNVSDNAPISNCSLIINGSVVNTRSNVQRNVEQTIYQNLDNGFYEWSVSCFDRPGNEGQSVTRDLTVNVTPVIYEGMWYETSTSDCSSFPCNIFLAQETDGTTNEVTGTLGSGQTVTIVEAISPFIGSNGAEVSGGSDVDFVSYFSSANDADYGRVYVLWYLYRQSEGGTNTLICSNDDETGTASNAASSGSCNVPNDVRLLSSDRLFYVIRMYNEHPAQSRTITHLVDHPSSYVDVLGFTQIGTLSALLVEPNESISVGQGAPFNLTCEVSCYMGSCLDVEVYAQSDQTGSWSIIADSNNIVLASDQSNPVIYGDIYNTSVNVTLELEGNMPGSANVRCLVESKYSSAITGSEKVMVMTTEEPVITLNYPTNNSWVNDEPLVFLYTPSTFSSLDYCELYIDGVLEDTDNSPSANSQNSFSVSGLSETSYNWSVVCEDIGGLVGYSDVYYFDVDRTPPYNLTIFSPEIPEVTVTQSWITFEWLVQDARSPELFCDIYIDEVLNTSVSVLNDTVSNVTIEGFDIGNYTWRLSCEDLAGNVNSTNTYNISVIDIPPVVELVSPMNYTGVNSSPALLEYIPFDGFGLQECRLFVDDELEDVDSSVVPNEVNSFSFAFLEEEYTWRVECLDSNDNTGISETWTFFGDFTLPSISLISPLNDSYFTQSSILFSYIATDNWPPLTCTVNFNDEPSIVTNTTSGAVVSETGTGYPDGFHDWNVMCVDIAGNVNVSETRFLTINESPIIDLFSPLNGSFLNDLVVNLSYTAFDNDGFDFCELYLNEEPEQLNSSPVISGNLSSFLVTDLVEGFYDWRVLCQDSGVFSNVNTSVSWSFVVDRTPPSLILLDPVEDQIIETSSHNFTFVASDEFSSTLSCDVFLNEAFYDSLVVDNATEAGIIIGGFLSGDYNWSVSCSDQAGNVNVSDTISFEVLLPPKITLVSPANNTGSDIRDTTFSFIPSEGSGVFPTCSLILNGEVNQNISDAPINEVSSFLVEDMADGAYEWNVECTDSNSITGSADEPWIYYIDTEPPYEFVLFNPLNDSVQGRNNVTFSFLARDKVSPELLCDVFLTEYEPIIDTYDIASVEVENNTPYTFGYLLPDGNYSWYVECFDKAGLSNISQEFFFEVHAPPNVTLVSPENYSWFDTDSVTLTYFPDDDILITQCELIINGEVNQTDSIISNKQNNFFSLSNLDEGEYNWTVACTDSDNNVFAPEPFSFYVDLFAPEVELHSPLDGALLDESSTVVFNWTATDLLSPIMFCDLVVNGEVSRSNIQVSNGVAHQEVVPGFSEDEHDWSVTCRDLAGNSADSDTWSFSVFIPPEITLISPANNLWTNVTNQEFVYHVFDDTGVEACSLFINDELNQTNTSVLNDAQNSFFVNNLDGIYTWRVECNDTTVLSLLGVSETRTLNVDLVPPSVSFVTENNSWFSGSPVLQFILTDNLANIINYEVFVNGSLEDSGSGNNGVVTSSELSGLTDGSYEVFVVAEDLAGNVNVSETLIINVDTIPPVVELNYPANDSEVFSSNVNLSFTATDNIADPLMCDVTLNSDIIVSDLSVGNGVEEIVEVTGLLGGLYVWNVTCYDFAGNPGVSDTWEFFVPIPDLAVDSEEIFFNNTAPTENELINITATIRNIGEGLAQDFDVVFWANEVDVLGNQIGDTINVDSLVEGDALNVSVFFTVPIGTTEIFVVVNPDQRVVESTYDNNVASRNISVEFWHYALGTTDDTLRVTDASLGLLFDWNVDNSTGSNIYVADFDSQISWTTLQALGRDVNGVERLVDFVLLDDALGTDEFGDSVNRTFTRDGDVVETATFDIFGQAIEDVPVVNSTTSDNFKTGILWDYLGSTEYSGSENVIFITTVNKNQVGYQGGVNDFEIRIPALLREYQGPDLERVIFYTEIK